MHKITGTENSENENGDPFDCHENEYEFEVQSNPLGINDVFLLRGGPTGYESFVMHRETVEAMKERGWRACLGTPGRFNRLSFTADQMKAAFALVNK